MTSEVRTSLRPEEEISPYKAELSDIYRTIGRISDQLPLDYDLHLQSVAERLLGDDEKFYGGTELHTEITSALVHDDTYELFSVGVTIGDEIVSSGMSARNQALAYLNACGQVDRTKISIQGVESPASNTNTITSAMLTTVAESLPPNESTLKALKSLEICVQSLAQQDEFFGWFVTKLQTLRSAVSDRYALIEVLSPRLEVLAQNIDLAAYGGLGKFKDDVGELVKRMILDRKYGIKPAFTEASIGGSWVFYDGEEYDRLRRAGAHNLSKLVESPLAVIYHATSTSLEDVRPSFKSNTFGNNAKTVSFGPGSNVEVDASLILGYDGKLYSDTSGLIGVDRDLADKPAVHAALLAELVSHVHDLTVPVGIVESTGSTPVSRMTASEKKKFNPVLDLFVPRLKKIQHAEGGHLNDIEESGRTVREHGVTWFVRKLPMGWKASPDAVENASRHQIILAENETFVRSHTRGKDNPVLGHTIVK